MKINTDGVLLGALAHADQPKNILDIGAGTGVIALMLAQRFENARIDAIEIDQSAADTAGRNFNNSPFVERMGLYHMGFEEFFESNPGKKYDLVVSNPPFFINSLKSPEANMQLAKHADGDFFERLITVASGQLTDSGLLCLILPVDTADLVSSMTLKTNLYQQKIITICSFEHSEPHRLITYFGFKQIPVKEKRFVIYKSVGNYSDQYVKLLKPYFIAF